MRLFAIATLTGAVLFGAPTALANGGSDEIICRDAQARTGDTLVCGGGEIRLWGVKAPGQGDANFEASRKALEKLTRMRTVRCLVRETTSRDVVSAVCFVDTRNLGMRQVRGGYATSTEPAKGSAAKSRSE